MKPDNQNPYIKTLPPIMDKLTFFTKIVEVPKLVYSKSIEVCIPLIHDIRNKLFIPLSYHYLLYLQLINVIRQNYQQRTPIEWIKTLNKIKQSYESGQGLTPFKRCSMLGFSVLGASGMGKTTMLDKILDLFPQLIVHKDLGIKQIVYLKIDCSTKGSTVAICRSFFAELDRVTGENYSRKFDRDSEEKLVIQMANKAILHQLGVLVIDECHNLETATRTNRKAVLNFFKELNNRVGIPIIYVGTAKAAPYLSGNYQTASRTQGIGMLALHPFEKNDPEWILFVDRLWNNQIFRHGKIPKPIREMYHAQSGGVLREVMQIHCNAQQIAFLNGLKSITAECVKATEKMLPVTSAVMRGIKNNDTTIKRHFSDLSMTAAYMYHEESQESESSKADLKQSEELLDRATKEWPKINKEQLEEIIATILEATPDLSTQRKFDAVNRAVANLQASGKVQAKSKHGIPMGELITMCANAKTSTDYYSILQEQGIITELSDIVEL